MRLPSALPLVLLVAALGSGAARADKPSPPANPLPSHIAAFTDAVYGAVRGESGNLFLSPFSVHAALSMTREGAAGETASEMDAALKLPEGGAGDGYLRLVAAMRPQTIRLQDAEVPAYALSVANALWVKEGFDLEPTFTTRLRDLYSSPVTRLDFTNPARAREAVHAWVSKETRGKITEILPEDQPGPDSRLILTNAVYFKASWEDPFSERRTQDEPFHRQDGTDVSVKMMHRTGHYPYRETPDAQILEIPYARRDLAMLVVLPKAKDGLPALEEKSKPSEAWKADSDHTQVAVTLPKFTFTWGGDLVATLRTLGMKRPFTDSADFSRMSKAEPLAIGVVLHKAFVAVDEKGTEAAAVTAVGMRATAMPGEPPRPVEFRADHPFQFLIVHSATGTILFVGRVMDPS